MSTKEPVDLMANLRASLDRAKAERDASRAVCADRDAELLALSGPCGAPCRLHYAHSGPCDVRTHTNG